MPGQCKRMLHLPCRCWAWRGSQPPRFFLIAYSAPCLKLPPPERLAFFELGGDDQDIFAGGDDADSRGLKHFPRLWCVLQGVVRPASALRLACLTAVLAGAPRCLTSAALF